MAKKYVMGCDGGTGGMRVGIYDLKGRELTFASTEYPVIYQHPGWAEQDPENWWKALSESIHKAMYKAGVTKDEILGISVDGTCGSLVLAEKDGTPVRDSLIWMDVRSTEEADYISSTNSEVMKFHGFGNASPEWVPCKAMWLKKHEPEVYARAEVACEYTDWIAFKLTGNWTMNMSSLAARWYYDSRNGGFPKEFYQQIGLDDFLEKVPERITSVGDNIGHLSASAAEFLGLSADTIVGQGGVDASIGTFGLGVCKPGRIAFVTGSSHLLLSLTDNYRYGRDGIFGPFPDATVKGYGLVEGGQTSSGSILHWFKTNFCADISQESGGGYDILNEEASKVPIGSEGLLVLDWWQGNRTPYTDQNIKGNIYGFSLRHTRAHVFRAIMEGVAFGTENILQSYRKAGFAADEVCMSGGTTNSRLWQQIHADVSNIVVNVPENTQAPALGSAIMAAVAAGEYTIDEAVENMVHYDRKIYPNPDNHRKYQEIFGQYQKAYGKFGDWMNETTDLIRRLENR